MHFGRWLNLSKFTRFLGGPNRPKICVGRTKPDFKDQASSRRDAVCWQITQRPFVSDWQWPCVKHRDAGHTRIKTELDKIGTKKQEVEQSVWTLSSLMLEPNRNWTFDVMTQSDFSIFPGSGKTGSTKKYQGNDENSTVMHETVDVLLSLKIQCTLRPILIKITLQCEELDY